MKNNILLKAYTDKTRQKIMLTMMTNPGITITELAKKLGKRQPTITFHIKKLEEAGLCRVKYESGKKGISKKCYYSFKGFFKELEKGSGKKLTEEDYKKVDKFVNHPTTIKIILNKLGKVKKPVSTISMMGLSSPLVVPEIVKHTKKDKKYSKVFNDYMKVFAKVQL